MGQGAVRKRSHMFPVPPLPLAEQHSHNSKKESASFIPPLLSLFFMSPVTPLSVSFHKKDNKSSLKETAKKIKNMPSQIQVILFKLTQMKISIK